MKIKVRNAYDESINPVTYENADVVESNDCKTFSIVINNKEIAVYSRENGMCYDQINETAATQEEADNEEVISSHEILKAAYTYILSVWAKETKRKESLNKRGKSSPIADFRIDKAQKQLDELHSSIIRGESERR